MTLEKIRKMAQFDANRTGEVVVILNFNPFNPLYVIRAYRDGIEAIKEYVETVKPERE